MQLSEIGAMSEEGTTPAHDFKHLQPETLKTHRRRQAGLAPPVDTLQPPL